MKINCKNCNKEIDRKPCEVKKTKNPTCSYECYGIFQRNRIKLKCFICSKKYERRKSEHEWSIKRGAKRNFCSSECRIKGMTGSKNSRWIKDRKKVKCRPNGNKDHVEWRMKVFKRDDYRCRDCGKRGGYIESHHIKTWSKYPKLRFVLNNGITLCRECHKQTIKKEHKFQKYYKSVLKY